MTLLDTNGVLMDPKGHQRIAPAALFTEEDVTGALLLLDQGGFNMLIFGEDNGEVRTTDREGKGSE